MTDDDLELIRSTTGGSARGLTLLDHFAAHALQGLLAWSPEHVDADGQFTPDGAALQAYKFAAAMLARRRELHEQILLDAAETAGK